MFQVGGCGLSSEDLQAGDVLVIFLLALNERAMRSQDCILNVTISDPCAKHPVPRHA